MSNRQKSYKAIIFDMDGVIIDSEPFYRSKFVKFFADHNKPFTDEVRGLLTGASSKMEFEIVSRYWGEEIEPAKLREMYKESTDGMRPDYRQIIFPDVYDVLGKIKEAGFIMALASSSGMPTIERVLNALELTDYFQSIVSGQMFAQSKPHPEIYLHSVDAIGLKVEDCLAVEDSTYGIQAAISAGLDVAAIKDHRFGFEQSKATYMLENLSEILPIIFQQNTKQKY